MAILVRMEDRELNAMWQKLGDALKATFPKLIQAAADTSSPATFEREVRALREARQEFLDASACLVTEAEPPFGVPAPEGIEIVPVWQWRLTR